MPEPVPFAAFDEPPDAAPASFDAKFDEPPAAAPASFDAKFDEPPAAAPASFDAKFDEPAAAPSFDATFDEPPAAAPASFDAKFDEPPAAAPASFDAKFDEPPAAAPASFDAKFDEPPAAAPAAPASNFDADGFADFSDGEDAPEGLPSTSDAPPDFEPEPEPVIAALPADERSKLVAAYRARVPDPSRGLGGEVLVSVTANAGLAQSDLSQIWQLVAEPGAATLGEDDFCLFMHVLKHRVNGGELPPALDADERARIFALSGGENAAMDAPAPTPEPAAASPPPPRAITAVIESFGGVKDGAKLSNLNVAATLVDAAGTPLEPAQSTPMGAATPRSDGTIVFDAPVTFRATHGSLPPGSALVLELRHFKAKEKKMSTRCWAFATGEQVAPGVGVELPAMQKPTDAKRKKVKPLNKGAPDVRIRFA